MKLGTFAALLVATLLMSSATAQATEYVQTNLVSDLSGQALLTDPNLVNPWGLVPGASGVFWTANNGTGTSSLYDPDGTIRSLVVTIPGGSPTGVVVTAAADSAFWIPSADSSARAVFIFVTQNGTVAAWSPAVNNLYAIQVDSTAGASYTGAAIGGTSTAPLLYAANFAQGTIDVYNRDFQLITVSGGFDDPNVPGGYSPFNIANVGGQLYVAWAERDTITGDEVAGTGLGYVSVFDMNGTYLRTFASGSPLNAPWAIVQAPAGFGDFSGSVLVGNFGDGRINAFDAGTGAWQGTLSDTLGNPIAIQGLWGLHFGSPVSGGTVAERLYFAAGIQDEAHGLFGYLAVADTTGGGGNGGGVACLNEPKGLGWWRHVCGGPNPRNGHDGSGNGHGNEHPGGGGGGPGHGPGGGGGGGGDNGGGGNGGGGHGPGVPADSLDMLFGCIRSADGPNAFGSEGCFTAGCDLLQRTGRMSLREHAARTLLMVRLNLCSGLTCDSLAVTCGNGTWMLGDLADSLDQALCDGASSATLRSLMGRLACFGEGDEDESGDDDSGDYGTVARIVVRPIGATPARLGGEPVRFAVSTAVPAMVRLRIYDAQGRLVAQPLYSWVVGSVETTWDHRSASGGMVSPGTYFYRATDGRQTASGRIVVLR